LFTEPTIKNNFILQEQAYLFMKKPQYAALFVCEEKDSAAVVLWVFLFRRVLTLILSSSPGSWLMLLMKHYK